MGRMLSLNLELRKRFVSKKSGDFIWRLTDEDILKEMQEAADEN